MPDESRTVQIIRHVLIVEDDYELADVLSEVLTHENCVPDHAPNGMEALSKIRSTHYDAIICDLMMPRVDGKAFFDQVIKDYPHLSDQFLFITGQSARQAGLTDFIMRTGNALLEKPFNIDEFRAALQELLTRND
jgi:two-component system, cell cycle sensor histidine kinase and response regulator CckA